MVVQVLHLILPVLGLFMLVAVAVKQTTLHRIPVELAVAGKVVSQALAVGRLMGRQTQEVAEVAGAQHQAAPVL
jgi:hypothetical protein